jgi:hypothetical protein
MIVPGWSAMLPQIPLMRRLKALMEVLPVRTKPLTRRTLRVSVVERSVWLK